MASDQKYSWKWAIPLIIIFALGGWVIALKLIKLMGLGVALLEHGGM